MQPYDDVNRRRSDSYPVRGSLTPSQRVRAVAPKIPVSNWEAGLLAGLIIYTVVIAAWLASGSSRLTEWHLFAGVAPALVIVAAQTLATQAAMTRETDTGVRSFWRMIALGQLLLALATLFAVFVDERHNAETAQTIRMLTHVALQPLMLIALLQLPSSPRNVVDKSRYWIDVATVAVGGMLVLWFDLRTPGIIPVNKNWNLLALSHA
ncbi:MAG: hypothetical protein ABJC26_18150, partial [Gemmatimonadaceae bacterium]